MTVRSNGLNTFIKITNEETWQIQKKHIEYLAELITESGGKPMVNGQISYRLFKQANDRLRGLMPDARDLPDPSKTKNVYLSTTYQHYIELEDARRNGGKKLVDAPTDDVQAQALLPATQADILASEQRMQDWFRENLKEKWFR